MFGSRHVLQLLSVVVVLSLLMVPLQACNCAKEGIILGRSGLIWYNCSATKVDVNEPVTVQVHIADIIMEYDGEGFPEYLYGVDNIPEGFTWAYQWISPGEDEQPVITVRETVWEQSTIVHPIDEEMEFTDSIELQFDRAGTVIIRLQQPDNISPILFEVVDNLGSGPCTITVGGPPNNPPILYDIGDKSVTEEHLLEFAVSATDPDGDELTYSASLFPEGVLPAGALFDENNGNFSWTPAPFQAGTYRIRFVVDDCNDTDYEDITITVNSLNVCWNTLWQIGDVEEDQMADPQDELDLSAPVGIQDFHVGVDSDDQFPAGSDYDDNIAPTINIHFTSGMPLGGRLLFSWSPGASGVEIMTISLDGTVLDTLEREGSPDESWWQSYERFIDTFCIGELDEGEHILTFEFSSGNGAVWDWVRFEEWTCQGVRSSYNLTVSSSTGGSVVEPGEGTFTYGRNEQVDLVAEADEGYQFDRWEGLIAVAGTTIPATTTVSMYEDKTVTAYFIPIQPFKLTSTTFDNNGPIPTKCAHYWAGGSNISPQLEWTGVPEDTQSFVLIMEDPEGWIGTPCVHWIVFNIPANVTSLAEGASSNLPEGAVHGIGSDGDVGYYGCEPPPGELHYYHFTIYALDTTLDLSQGATKSQVIAAMEGHKLGEAELVGTYQG